jgi:RNA polymerase sigma-70 factor (ECF subfamily)
MHTTPVSLLQRLGRAPTEAAWERFVRLYTPLLFYWARHAGLQEHDAADLVQDVLLVLVQKLPEFQYQPGKSFRGWMRTVLLNKWRDRRAPAATVAFDSDIQSAGPDGVALLEEEEYRRYLVGRALRLMQTDFEPATWQACWETVVCDRPPTRVAAELGITVNAVYLAKSRVLAQLRCDLDGLLD